MTDGTQSYVYVQEKNGTLRASATSPPARCATAASSSSRASHAGEIVVEEGGVLLDNQIDLSN